MFFRLQNFLSLRARLTPCVAIHKFKQTLPQKFKQKPKFCHTDLSCLIDLFSLIILTLNKRKCLKSCYTDEPCHTERKRSIHKFKVYFKFLWIFRYAQNDKFFVILINLSYQAQAKYPRKAKNAQRVAKNKALRQFKAFQSLEFSCKFAVRYLSPCFVAARYLRTLLFCSKIFVVLLFRDKISVRFAL